MIPFGLAAHATKLKYLVNENSTTILTGVGVVGTVATAYLTGRASFKAAEIITEEKKKRGGFEKVEDKKDDDKEYTYPVFKRPEIALSEKVKLVWPQYIPPVTICVVTVASIIMANKISSKKIAALTIASGVSERAFQEYKDKVVEKLGVRQDQKIRDDVVQDRVNADPSSSEVIITEDSYKVLCYDTMTGRYFRSTVEDIKRAENSVNHQINQSLGVSLSHFFEEIGLEPTVYTDSVGWNINNLAEVQFSTVMSLDNRPCVAVSFARMPSPNYDNAWT